MGARGCCVLALLALSATVAIAGTKEEWKSRAIYQVLTDRFARGDGSQSQCPNLSDYCGTPGNLHMTLLYCRLGRVCAGI